MQGLKLSLAVTSLYFLYWLLSWMAFRRTATGNALVYFDSLTKKCFGITLGLSVAHDFAHWIMEHQASPAVVIAFALLSICSWAAVCIVFVWYLLKCGGFVVALFPIAYLRFGRRGISDFIEKTYMLLGRREQQGLVQKFLGR